MLRFLPLALLLSACGYHQTEISWSFANVEEGYDHQNRTDVYVDGQIVAASSVRVQTEANQVEVALPAGSHALRVVNMALYEGAWEEHTVENDYSIDCLHEMTYDGQPPKKIRMNFDLDGEPSVKVR